MMILHASAHRLPLKDESVHCVVTSPPYWGLRDYHIPPQIWGGDAVCAHQWGALVAGDRRGGSGTPTEKNNRGEGYGRGAMRGSWCQHCSAWRGHLGLEPTPELYLEHLLTVFREVKRVLRPDGTCWINIGDCYASQGGPIHQGKGINDLLGGKQETQDYNKSRVVPNGLKPKDLCGIPWRVALALQADGWWLRSDIIWAKPNPMPESVTDRPTRSHEYLFLLAKHERYYYDAEAVKEPLTSSSILRLQQQTFDQQTGGKKDYGTSGINTNRSARRALVNLKGRAMPPQVGDSPDQWAMLTGRNLRSVWEIPTQSFEGAHFATFPEKLVEPCVLAGTSTRGCCPTCGAPWARIIEKTPSTMNIRVQEAQRGVATPEEGYRATEEEIRNYNDSDRFRGQTTTIGWKPTCIHGGNPVPSVVLDPFGGSGTVGEMCERLGRRWISVDLAYHDLAKARTAQRGLVL